MSRSFSFEPEDDQSLHDPQPQSYHPPPPRDILSPPPRYASPQPNPSSSSPSTSPRRRPAPQDTYLLSDTSPTRALTRGGAAVEDPSMFAPPPPPHRSSGSRLDDSAMSQPYRPYSNVTTGVDDYGGHSAGGGFNSIPQGVAQNQPRENGVDAVRSMPRSSPPYDRGFPGESNSYPDQHLSSYPPGRNSYGSSFALAGGAATPGTVTPSPSLDPRSSAYSGRSIPLEDYGSNPNYPQPYSSYHDLPTPYASSANSNHFINQASSINPNAILDDGDDGFVTNPRSSQHRGIGKGAAATGAAAGTAGGMAGIFGRKAKNHTTSGTYDAVGAGSQAEKSEWLSRQKQGKRKMKLWVGVAIGLFIVLAIVGGIVGGVLGTRNSDNSSSGDGSTNNAAGDTAANGDLGKDSAEIKALMNNPNLHKVFPGMDYTPWGTQYPLCFTYPPSQNNVTRDMAVLSQLTNVVRLYGTDCNQTEMVLHAMDRLGLDDMKLWMGVWIDTNQTTTQRQLDQMYKILKETKDLSVFKGVIVGNEALYRAGEDKAQSEQELINILTDVRTRFKSLGYKLPIATSDLGDNWNAQLVQVVDYVMSNIHPFFAGVTADIGAGWTWDFWQNHDVVLTQGSPNVKQIISETGWPSGGGKDCGGTDGSCTPGQSGAVASIDDMNTFMDDWVCQSLANGTDYFWFEAFDEPWKITFNTADQQWEDKWGLMDPGRNLKPGLKIPNCGGKTVGQ